MVSCSHYPELSELGVFDEAAFTVLGNSGQHYIVTMQRPTADAEKIFRGLAPVSQEDGYTECEVSRNRYDSLFGPG